MWRIEFYFRRDKEPHRQTLTAETKRVTNSCLFCVITGVIRRYRSGPLFSAGD